MVLFSSGILFKFSFKEKDAKQLLETWLDYSEFDFHVVVHPVPRNWNDHCLAECTGHIKYFGTTKGSFAWERGLIPLGQLPYIIYRYLSASISPETWIPFEISMNTLEGFKQVRAQMMVDREAGLVIVRGKFM